MKVKFDEPLKISGPYGDMDAKFQPCQDDEAPNNLLIMAHGFRGSMEGGGRAAYLSQMASLFVNVLRFNFTGSQILSHQIEELNAVLDFAMKEYKNPRIFYWGAAWAERLRWLLLRAAAKLRALLYGQRRMICTLLLKMRWAARITTV